MGLEQKVMTDLKTAMLAKDEAALRGNYSAALARHGSSRTTVTDFGGR